MLYYFVIMNVIGCLSMKIDKQRAIRGQWRVSEFHLMIIAFLGGCFGSLIGMYMFRHKTKHIKFVVGVPLICLFYLFLSMKMFSF